MATIKVVGTSERIHETDNIVTVVISGTAKRVKKIDISCDGITDIIDADVRASLQYYIQNPPYVIPVYVPDPNTMLAAYAAVLWLFQQHGNGEITVQGDIGTIPQDPRPGIVY